MKKFIALIVLVINILTLQAQDKIQLRNPQYDKQLKLSFGETNFALLDKTNTSFINEIFGSQPNTDFKYERSYKDNNGFTHHVYQQYHLGLKVYGASIGQIA